MGYETGSRASGQLSTSYFLLCAPLVIAGLLAVFVGCSEQPVVKEEPPAPKGTPTGKVAPPPGKPESLLVIRKVVPSTPEKGVQAYQQAVACQDWAKCWALLSKDTQAAWRARAAQYRKKFAGLPDGPESHKFDGELNEMGYYPAQGREMTGEMLMVGTCRQQFKAAPESFRGFVEAACPGHQQMGRHALVELRAGDQQHPGHVMAVRSGVLWFLELTPPNVLPTAPTPPMSPAERPSGPKR